MVLNFGSSSIGLAEDVTMEIVDYNFNSGNYTVAEEQSGILINLNGGWFERNFKRK
ncbi:hypothetical protein GR7B_00210 [Vibrio phage vB_VcorM_GR7B]|nr:hypothetical protein GR7B_00210 [Vibrio phage vB_VcorM_GR7B]